MICRILCGTKVLSFIFYISCTAKKALLCYSTWVPLWWKKSQDFYHGILHHRLFFFILEHEIESDDDYIDYDVDEDDTFDRLEMTCRRAVYRNANLMMGGQQGKWLFVSWRKKWWRFKDQNEVKGISDNASFLISRDCFHSVRKSISEI